MEGERVDLNVGRRDEIDVGSIEDLQVMIDGATDNFVEGTLALEDWAVKVKVGVI